MGQIESERAKLRAGHFRSVSQVRERGFRQMILTPISSNSSKPAALTIADVSAVESRLGMVEA